jgi:hypothetical protein
MTKDTIAICFIVFLISMLLFCAYMLLQLPRTMIAVEYDCRLAEISPDYPQVVKQKCRELMK